MLEGGAGGRVRLLLAVLAPGEVVEGPAAVGDPPMRHHAARIEFERLAKALYSFVLVEPVAPAQAEIEPALRLGRIGGDRSRTGAEVETVHSFLSSGLTTPARRAWLPTPAGRGLLPPAGDFGRSTAQRAGEPPYLFQAKRPAAQCVLLLDEAPQQRGKGLPIGPGERRDRTFLGAQRASIRHLEEGDALRGQLDQPPAGVCRIDAHRYEAALQE